MKKEKNREEKILEKLENAVNFDQALDEQAKETKENVDKLHSNVNFYKASIRGSEALMSTMELMKSGKGISISNLSCLIGYAFTSTSTWLFIHVPIGVDFLSLSVNGVWCNERFFKKEFNECHDGIGPG